MRPPTPYSCFVLLVLSLLAGCGSPTQEQDNYFFRSNLTLNEVLPKLPRSQIKKLRFERAQLSPEQMAIIGSFKHLERLEISECVISDEDYCHLSKLSKLRLLHLTQSNISDATISFMDELHSLESVQLQNRNLTDGALIHLTNARNLKELRLNSGHINGSGLKSLGHLDSLRTLVLNGCPIEDDEVKYIANFPLLRTLWMSGTHVTDQGLLHLGRNYWLLNVCPSEAMTVQGLQAFRRNVLKARQAARDAAMSAPPDDTLFIQTNLDANVRGAPPTPEYTKRLGEFGSK